MNTQKLSKNTLVILLSILAVAALVRVPGMKWGIRLTEKPNFATYEEGEFHLAWLAERFIETGVADYSAYPKGFPFQMYAGTLLWRPFEMVDDPELIFTGRWLALSYSILMILLQFFLVRWIFKDERLALVSSAMLSLMGFFVSKGHIASADPGTLFWMYATMFFSLLALEPKAGKKSLAFAVFSCGMALALKMSFFAVIPIVYVFARKKLGWKWYFGLPLALAAIFILANGCGYTWTNLLLTINNVLTDNMDVREYNKLYNLMLYPALLAPGLGLPVFLFAVYGAVKSAGKNFEMTEKTRDIGAIILLPVMLHVISILFIGYVGMRHIMPVFPILAVFAALGFLQMSRWKIVQGKNRLGYLTFLLLAYQLFYIASIEYYFIFDTRKAATDWIYRNVRRNETIALPRHSVMPLIARDYTIVDSLSADYIVMHEVNFARYSRSYLNPMKDFPGYEEVFHRDPTDFKVIQGVFKGELPYQLVKKFEARPFTPETMIYKKFFGTFMDCYGDTLIYKRTGDDA